MVSDIGIQAFYSQRFDILDGAGTASGSVVYDSLDEAVKEFEAIPYTEIKGARFRKRATSKYVIPGSTLSGLLRSCSGRYLIAERNGERVLPVGLVYFDTPGLRFFNQHVNGKLKRVKVRTRMWLRSGEQTLEIWKRKNKGTMLKRIVPLELEDGTANGKSENLFEEYSGVAIGEVQASVALKYCRITLVNETLSERITIDTNLKFALPDSPDGAISLPDLAIVEVRHAPHTRSFAGGLMKTWKIRKLRISKYCLGVSLLKTNAKVNSYKPILRNISKTIMYDYVE